jgi:hypothetical protein
MRKVIIVVSALAAFLAWTVLMLVVGQGIEEDSPLWICQLMGNMQCG